jgi:hypothetical protein
MTCETAVRDANEGVLFPDGCVWQRLSSMLLHFTSCTRNLAHLPVFASARVARPSLGLRDRAHVELVGPSELVRCSCRGSLPVRYEGVIIILPSESRFLAGIIQRLTIFLK